MAAEGSLGPAIGQIATSRAGRDKGHAFLVVGGVGGRYALIADGGFRGVEKPKRKNLRHLVLHQEVPRDIADLVAQGKPLTNEDVRRALARWAGGTGGRG